MNPEQTPLLSVLMGTRYLREDCALLARAVESVRAQSFPDFEFLICDDGSSRAAQEYLDRAAAEDPRIRLIRPGDKLRLAEKLNACLAEARGQYLGRMDDDDYSDPERFQKQLSELSADPGIAFVGCNVRLLRGGQDAGVRILPEYPGVRDFYVVQPFIHPTLIFRREALSAVGGYSERPAQELCEDYDLLLRLYAKGLTGKNLQEPLFTYSVPLTAKGGRRMRHRLNEARTRYARYRQLGVLPGALPYVIKPVVTGLIPEKLLHLIKRWYYE